MPEDPGERVAESVRRLVAGWPPLSAGQRAGLSSLLAPGGVLCDQGGKFEGVVDTAGGPATA